MPKGVVITSGRPRCPKCKSPHVYSMGTRITVHGRVKKWQCQKCAHAFSSPHKKSRRVGG